MSPAVTAVSFPQLDAWLEGQPADVFPPGASISYPKRFSAVSEYLNSSVHPFVEKSALEQDGGFLTDHGPGHVKNVIRRVSELVGDPASHNFLSHYEVYLLLMAIHLHDVGNIYGRKQHEKKLAQVVRGIEPLLVNDSIELKTIIQIAAAHGGVLDGDKDTIGPLPLEDHIHSERVKFRQLAALVRLADELADDNTRASRFLLSRGLVPRKSEVFHAYAANLHTAVIDRASRSILLRFQIARSDALKKFGKGNKRVFLLDEIFDRSLKMHIERIYCCRFLEPALGIDQINTRIDIFESSGHTTPLKRIEFTLREQGYPSIDQREFKRLCPEVKWSGESLKNALQGRARRRRDA